MNKIFILVALMTAAASSIRADTEAMPEAYVTASHDGIYFFKLVPPISKDRYNRASEKLTYGIAYQVLPDGSNLELWRTEGWYSFRVFLSGDGKYLARLGPWNSGDQPSKDDLAVAFYKEGKLLKQYSTEQLVKDKSKVKRSISHYEWFDFNQMPKIGGDGYFHLKTLDGISYLFDMTTGNIKETKK